MIKRPNTNAQRLKRHKRVRAKISGTDDVNGVTLCSASSLKMENGSNKEAAREVGKMVAEAAKQKGIEVVVFDRGGYLYHGRVAELAEGAREGGLKF